MIKVDVLTKILVVILVTLLLASCVAPIFTFADDWKSTTQFDGKADNDLNGNAKSIIGAILGVVRIVAVGIALIMLIVVAMKYMMSAPGDRADIKKHAVVYVVGAVVLFASAGILDIIQKFSDNVGTSGGGAGAGGGAGSGT